MGVVVSFDYAQWVALFPEFIDRVTPPQAQEYFYLATSYHRNDGIGPINDPTRQLSLLNLVTAHIAELFGLSKDGDTAPRLVGRITSANQGSVSVQVDDFGENKSDLKAFFLQTRYGAAYWAGTARIRTFLYVHGRVRATDPVTTIFKAQP